MAQCHSFVSWNMPAPQMGHQFLLFSHPFYPSFLFFSSKAKRVILLEVLESLTKQSAAGPGRRNEQIISNPVVPAFYFYVCFSLRLLSISPAWLSWFHYRDNRQWQTYNSCIDILQFKLQLYRLIKSKFLIPRREHLEQFGSRVYLWSSQLWLAERIK